MLDGIIKPICHKLAFDFLRGTTSSVSFGIAALNHKSINDAVKGQPIIKAGIHKIQEVVYRIRYDIMYATSYFAKKEMITI